MIAPDAITDRMCEVAIEAQLAKFTEQALAEGAWVPKNPTLSGITGQKRIEVIEAMRCAIAAAFLEMGANHDIPSKVERPRD